MVAASREFQVMSKPVGAVCNLDCSYCYYLGKKALYPRAASPRMADDLLESYIVQHIEACPINLIFFSWHGGEPTVLGLDYFRRIVELQRKHRPPGRQILNGIQTNGTLIDDEWCRFLARECFQVGISIDGPKELHDSYRVTKGGNATHKQVMQSFRLMKKYQIPCDVLCVVHNRNVRQPAAVYGFFREIGVQFLQFLPLVMRQGESGATPQSVPADAYGSFLCTIFDEWVRHDIGRITIQNFEEAERPFRGADHALCLFRETCGDIVVVEHNGDFYCCDHFVDAEHRLGNIRETPLVELLESPALRAFGRNKKDGLPRCCRQLRGSRIVQRRLSQRPLCRERRTTTNNLNYLCAGYKQFFTYSRPYLQQLAALRRSGEPIERLMPAVQSEDAAASNQAGRNDPCPCGSGRKYKKCCLGKSSFGGKIC